MTDFKPGDRVRRKENHKAGCTCPAHQKGFEAVVAVVERVTPGSQPFLIFESGESGLPDDFGLVQPPVELLDFQTSNEEERQVYDAEAREKKVRAAERQIHEANAAIGRIAAASKTDGATCSSSHPKCIGSDRGGACSCGEVAYAW